MLQRPRIRNRPNFTNDCTISVSHGEITGKNVLAAVTGYELTPFTYKSLGTVCSIGNTSAIGVVGDEHEVRGYPASMLQGKVTANKCCRNCVGIGKSWLSDAFFDLYH